MSKEDPLGELGWDPKTMKIEWTRDADSAWHDNVAEIQRRLKSHSEAMGTRTKREPLFPDAIPFLCVLLPGEGNDTRTYSMKNPEENYTYLIHFDADPMKGYDQEVSFFADSIIFDRVKKLWNADRLPKEDATFQFEDGGLKRLE